MTYDREQRDRGYEEPHKQPGTTFYPHEGGVEEIEAPPRPENSHLVIKCVPDSSK